MSVLKLVVVALGVTLCSAHGHHHSLLGGLLSSAHNTVKGTIGEVASVVTTGLSHGLNINFESSVQVGQQSGGHFMHPPPPPQPNPDNYEVIVIVEDTNPNENQGYRPPPPMQGYQPNQNGYRNPTQPNYSQMRPQNQPGYGQQPCQLCQTQNNLQNQQGYGQTGQPGHNNNQGYGRPSQPTQSYGQPNVPQAQPNIPQVQPNIPQVQPNIPQAQPSQPPVYNQPSQSNYNNQQYKPQPPLTTSPPNQQGHGQLTNSNGQSIPQPNQPVYANQQPTNNVNNQVIQTSPSPAPTQDCTTLPGYGKPIPLGYTYGQNDAGQNELKPTSNGIPNSFPTQSFSGQPPQNEDPTNIYKPIDEDKKPVNKVTEKAPTKSPLDNEPLYVPLNSEGDADKLYVNAPKRETQEDNDNLEYPIDIRFKEQ